MTNALSSFATLLKIGDGGGPENFTTIAEVLDISGPGLAMRTAEATNHSSPAGWAEFIGTILEGGEVTFDINFIPTNATHSYSAGLLQDFANKTARNFQLVFPDTGATTWAFTALVTQFPIDGPVEGILRANVTLMVTGQPTLA